jgi:hypothetical protein
VLERSLADLKWPSDPRSEARKWPNSGVIGLSGLSLDGRQQPSEGLFNTQAHDHEFTTSLKLAASLR